MEETKDFLGLSRKQMDPQIRPIADRLFTEAKGQFHSVVENLRGTDQEHLIPQLENMADVLVRTQLLLAGKMAAALIESNNAFLTEEFVNLDILERVDQ